MQFKGRTVAAFMLLTMAVSVLVTLTVEDRWVALGSSGSPAGAAASETTGSQGLSQKELGKLNTVMSLIESKYFREIDRSKIVDGAITGMMSSLGDPYSVYMEKEVAQHFSETIEGSFTGIGAGVALKDGKITIESAIKGSPAERAGILPNDVLLSVDGEKLDGISLADAVAKIRGPKGSKVKLTISREGVSQPVQLTIVRDDIDYETVYAHLRSDGIGVIEIRQFSLNTGDRFLEELASLEKQGMKGLIIDVRGNPGGVLPVVVSIAQPFVAKGEPIVQVEDKSGHREKTLSTGGGKSYPIAVLMNKGSASASEVLAGALKEEAHALLVGDTSFGKGTVQVSYEKVMADGSLIKMTIAKWLTPLGNWVHEKGLKPDVQVLLPDFYNVVRMSKTKTLVRDTIEADTKSLQIMLGGLGYKIDRKDGYYSAVTESQVKAFQKDNGLAITGKTDKATAVKIEEKLSQTIKDEKNDIQLSKAVIVLQQKLGVAR
ncbi:peptidase S41 [Paenibacillus baekrokdamisoli]|uniref:Peptidase S41 n=1 Tax=Paenibacillus baekrokdamisoli TaxID=1712516 RepID=A0A3G9JDG1_9BACL|nr:S41 family peptidase [Paenibacillus baekrokdamisoli]MBB3073316.1 carboxyl-terminal processing protease [Paenibacillus baekrokdamisoli]BBH23941.1 peptidase S41 [Paenibacillus baekrokdamisoli]